MRSDTSPSIIFDTEEFKRKQEGRANNPYRIKEGTFHAPRNASKEALARELYGKTKFFLSHMEKEGWVLASRVKVKGPFKAFDLETNLPILDKYEFRVRGVFKHINALKTTRIELDPVNVKQAPDHIEVAGNREDLKRQLRGTYGEKLIAEKFPLHQHV